MKLLRFIAYALALCVGGCLYLPTERSFMVRHVWAQSDLTPSVNYFNYDYGAVSMSDAVDSIIAWRYEVLVADASFGTGYATKYRELYANDPSFSFYVYVDGINNWHSSGSLGPIIDSVGAYIDSVTGFYHSADTADYDSCGGTAIRVAFATDEFNSRLLSYTTECPGPRSIPRWAAPGYPTAFTTYAAALKAKHDTTNWTLTGLWFDNRAIPQTGNLNDCSEYPLLYETNLGGGDIHWGCETKTAGNTDYHVNFLNVELIHYTKVLADTVAALTGLKVAVNAVGFSDSDEDVFFHGRHHAYYVADSQGVDRSQEWMGVTTETGMFSPGPTNAATSIDSATVCAVLSPIDIYTEVKVLDADGVGEWFNPRPRTSYRGYNFTDHHYWSLCLYYLWRGRYTHLSIAVDPNVGSLNWIDGGASGGRCVGAGNAGDTCYWIDALGVRVGRDGQDAGWSTDIVRFYRASVQCVDCIDTTGVGADSEGQNWVVFSRQWTGDDDYKYLILLRPTAENQHVWGATTESGSVSLPAGDWNKLDKDGAWGGAITSDTYMNGEGGIYRQAMASTTATKLRGGYFRGVKVGQ